MPNLEWEVPHTLQSSQGTLDLNVWKGGTFGEKFWQIMPDYKIVPGLRTTKDNLSQQDGSALHPPLKTGLVATLTVHYLTKASDGPDYVPACEATLREMHDELLTHLNALRTLTDSDQRLIWTPTSYGDHRFIDFVQCAAWADPVRDPETNETGVSFALESPFPYALDLTQTLTPIVDGATATLTMVGSSSFSPVVKAFGPFTSFGLVNSTSGKAFYYDGSRPGASSIAGGHYLEIDFFKGTVTLDGSVTFLDAGIDPLSSDFFTLDPGPNVIAPTGADIDVLWNQAWS